MRSADVALAVRANAWSTGSRSSSSIAASAGVAQARQRARAAAMRGQRGANDFDITCSGFLSRSEEHTSELQSLMRISYAVFCLKKTKSIIQFTQYGRDETCNITSKQTRPRTR